MKNFLDNKTSSLMTIVILAVGSISGVVTTQMVRGSDGGNINGSIVACVYGACKDNTFNGGSSSGGGGGQPTPNTGKLIVIKKVATGLFCPFGSNIQCKPSDFTITVSGVTASPSSFPGDSAGTTVTVSPGTYTVFENMPAGQVSPSFSGDCEKTGDFAAKAKQPIGAGETQTCTITNGNP